MSADDARELWRAAVERSRAVVAATPSLDAISARENGPSMRWILVHFIEEYARHLGHADLIAQSIDGRTGE